MTLGPVAFVVPVELVMTKGGLFAATLALPMEAAVSDIGFGSSTRCFLIGEGSLPDSGAFTFSLLVRSEIFFGVIYRDEKGVKEEEPLSV